MASHLSRLLLSAATVAIFGSPALAQEVPSQSSDADSSSAATKQGDEALPNTEGAQEPTGGLEEIVVTAQRREENLQDVPLAVTAIDADALAKNDIRDLSRVEF